MPCQSSYLLRQVSFVSVRMHRGYPNSLLIEKVLQTRSQRWLSQQLLPLSTASTSSTVRPRASNPPVFRQKDPYREKKQPVQEPRLNDRFHRHPMKAAQNSIAGHPNPRTLGEQFDASGKMTPKSCWVTIGNIPPMSSLEAILMSVGKALDIEQRRGILDLDAVWQPDSGEPLPFLPIEEEARQQWVTKAKSILSPFGRPSGWYLQLRNRSIVHALLTHSQATPLQCSWKTVQIQEYNGSKDPLSLHQGDEPHWQITDATVRVENCPPALTNVDLLNLFSRFDLTTTGLSIVPWQGRTDDGRRPPTTVLLHFADASWARAAVREKQGSDFQGTPLRLAQYPKQML